MKVLVFKSEKEAEQFVTEGYPVFGKNLAGEEVKDRGITTRVANWFKNPNLDEWYVEASEGLVDKDAEVEDIDFEKMFPKPKFF